VDRFQFVPPLPGFYIIPTIDFDVEGLVSGKTISQGQPYDVTQSDDAHTYGIVLARKDTDQKARTKLDAGGTVVNYGLYFQYRSQRNEYNQNGNTTQYTQQDPYQTPIRPRHHRDAFLVIPCLWFKFERRPSRSAGGGGVTGQGRRRPRAEPDRLLPLGRVTSPSTVALQTGSASWRAR
jgi:hypothetical protein